MNLASLVRAAVVAAALPALVGAQTSPQGAPQAPSGVATTTRIAVINIDRIAAESNAGKALFEKLKEENDRLAAERAKREQEIRDLQAKMASEVLAADAKERLQKDIDRKRTDAQRWLEDAQKDFEDKQQQGEEEFQKALAPVVEELAKKNGIGLILRATPGLTFVLDPSLDITQMVIDVLNQAGSTGEAPKPDSPPATRE